MSAAIREALSQILREDDNAFLIGEDIGVYGGAFKITRGFVEEFGPTRVIDTPMSEAGFVSIACGAALLGSRPIVEIMFMDFLALAMDGLVNVAVKWRDTYGSDFRMPVVIRCPAGAGRSYGPTHSQSFEGLLLNVPGITICCPATPAAAAGLLLGAFDARKPVVFIEPKALYARKGEVPDVIKAIPLGGGVVACEGSDITIVSYGRQLHAALAAAEQLRTQGVAAEVLDLQTIKPLDEDLIVTSLAKTGRGICVEESPIVGGVGSEVSAVVMENAFEYLEAPFTRLGAAERPVPCSPKLEKECFPTVANIVETAIELCQF